MAESNLTQRTPSSGMSDVAVNVYRVIAYLDGMVAILSRFPRSRNARASRAIVIAAARSVASASEMLDEASVGNLTKAEVLPALRMIQDAEDAMVAARTTIEAADEYGAAPESPAFPSSDPLDSAALLASRCHADLVRSRRQAAAAVRALPEPFKFAA